MLNRRHGKQVSFYLDNRRAETLADYMLKLRSEGKDTSEAGVLRAAFDAFMERERKEGGA